jgi:hypothetical protein
VDAINKLDTDSGHGGSKNQTITMISPLWEIDGEDLLELRGIVSKGGHNQLSVGQYPYTQG